MIRALIVLMLCAAAPVALSQASWVEGTHYTQILPPQSTGLPPGKIAVVEIFSYACPGCNRFYPVIDRLAASLPSNAVMQYLPAAFRNDEDWPLFQRAYFAAQALGISQRMHDATFDAVWKTGELAVYDQALGRAKHPLPALPDIARFYEKAAGVDAQKFMTTAMSFGIEARMHQADQFIAACGVGETPTIVVNGKYRLNPVTAGGYDETIELVKYLVAKESRAP